MGGGGGGTSSSLVTVTATTTVTPPQGPANKKQKTKPAAVPAEYISNRPVPKDDDVSVEGECNMAPEDKNPWIQTSYTDDSELVKFMGYPQPQHECFACMHMNPAKGIQKGMVPLERTRLDQLNLNLNAVVGHPNINQACIDVAREFEENIRQPANRHLKPGQSPLPPWNPATVKVHLFEHTNNPVYKRIRRLEQVNNVLNTAYDATKEVHPVKKKRNGKPMTRVNPDQWKIMREAIETEHKLTFDNFGGMMSNWDALRGYMQKNGSDFVDISQKNVYYHLLQNGTATSATNKS